MSRKRRKQQSREHILVVYKQAPRASRRTPASAIRAHLRTLERLYQLLQDRGCAFRAIPVDQLRPLRRPSLVITVGGDGTVLATSHFVTKQTVLGVKSFGQTSVGHFCAATSDTLESCLDAVLRGRRRPRQLSRLTVRIDGHPVDELVLNDVLFAHGSPAAITDYRLTIGKRSELQRSSGLWISTAAGSTAAILGAGGKVMPLTSERIQYKVREPYMNQAPFRLLGGSLPSTSVIRIESLIRHGTLSIDGAHIQYPIPEGTKIAIRRAKIPLNIYWK